MPTVISQAAIDRRNYWINEIDNISGKFEDDATKLESELSDDVAKLGLDALVDHMRLCGDIPESYHHDSSQEKLYSKYTDCVVSEAFKSLGMQSLVLRTRADVADVEVFAKDFSFVADAKAFRLSRTAKNQKDFKVVAMDTWKRGKKYAMLVCPVYQLPTRTSQIYEQAITRNVCIFTYSHLAMITLLAKQTSVNDAVLLLTKSFETVAAMIPSKDAHAYWTQLNRTMFAHSPLMMELWNTEKQASSESLKIAKNLALTHLASERERIMRMGHQAALQELITGHKLDSKIRTITGMAASTILDLK